MAARTLPLPVRRQNAPCAAAKRPMTNLKRPMSKRHGPHDQNKTPHDETTWIARVKLNAIFPVSVGPRKKRENVQLIEHSQCVFNLSQFSEGSPKKYYFKNQPKSHQNFHSARVWPQRNPTRSLRVAFQRVCPFKNQQKSFN